MILYTEKIQPGNQANISLYAALQAYINMGFETVEVSSLANLHLTESDHIFLGSIQFIQSALRKLNRPVLPPLDYPESLHAFLGRTITSSTINHIAHHPQTWNNFVKPKGFLKKFTGRLVTGPKDLVGCGQPNEDIPVWVSEPVTFVAEWRVYVRHKKVLGVKQYRGDWKAFYNPEIIEAAIDAYTEQPAAYALDFGRTHDNRFLLVEANDGYSLGNYGLFYVDYAKLLATRWAELAGTRDLCDF